MDEMSDRVNNEFGKALKIHDGIAAKIRSGK